MDIIKYKFAINQNNQFKLLEFSGNISLEEAIKIGLMKFEKEVFESYAVFQNNQLVFEKQSKQI